jgi:hypothetical protein
MFHFPTFPPHTLYIQMRVTRHHSCWVSPFGNPRISARLTAPRGLSQPPTSFIGSWCQGIHRTLLNTYKQRCSRPLCSSQTTHKTEPDATPARTTALRYDCESSLVVILPKRKHSRVLSGPNSVSIYPPRSKTQLRPPAMKPVSVPPMSIRRTTYASETVSATRRLPSHLRGCPWRCAP